MFDCKKSPSIFFSASPAPKAQKAYTKFVALYGQTPSVAEADVIVSLGGDGQMISDARAGIREKKPIFGINYGTVGYLMNRRCGKKDLYARLRRAEPIKLSPLRVEATFLSGDVRTDFAINEVQVCNNDRGRSIYLGGAINGAKRIKKLGGDGVLIVTTVGSTGYNKSAGGSILPLGDDLLQITPLNAFAPLGIRPAVIRPADVQIKVLQPKKRKADVFADSRKLGSGVKRVSVQLDIKNPYTLLFDPGYSLHEKGMRSQFPNFGP